LFFHCYLPLQYLHSFPTRRSSDLEADSFLKDADENYEVTRPEYQTFFADGTRPSEWVGDVPTKDEIIEALVEQDKYIQSFSTSRSEEHTSELQSRFDLVCRLLLEI